jgi:hypothetical protein
MAMTRNRWAAVNRERRRCPVLETDERLRLTCETLNEALRFEGTLASEKATLLKDPLSSGVGAAALRAAEVSLAMMSASD